MRSFVQEVNLEFPEQGLFCIKGIDSISGGTSGIGKTNFYLPIYHAIGFHQIDPKYFQSWHTNSPPFVELVLEKSDGNYLKIQRSTKTFCETKDGRVEGAKRGINRAIEDFLGIPKEMFRMITLRYQGDGNHFLTMFDGERKNFLTKLLELEDLEKLQEDSLARYKSLIQHVDFKQGSLENLKNKCKEPVKPKISNLAKLSAGVKKIKEDLFSMEEELNIAKNAWEKKLLERKGIQSEEFTFDKKIYETKEYIEGEAKLVVLNKSHKEVADKLSLVIKNETISVKNKRAELKELDNMFATIPMLKDNLEVIKKQIASMENNVCPTCSQNWPENDKIEFHKSRANNVIKDIQRIGGNRPKYDLIEAQIRTSEANIESLKVELDRINKTIDSVNLEMQNLHNTLSIKRAEANEAFLNDKAKRLAKVNEEIEMLGEIKNAKENRLKINRGLLAERESQFNMALSTNREIEALYSKSLSDYKELLEEIAEVEKDIEVSQKDLNKAKDLREFVHHFLANYFDEILQDVSYEANRMFRLIPNVQDITIKFSNIKSDEADNLKKDVKAVFYKGGNIIQYKEGFSGGQKSAVKLVVDLALGDVVSKRKGIYPNWLILDEAFDGLGPVEKEGVFDILKAKSQEKLIFVVDHATEFKEQFDKFFVIEYDGKRSTLKEVVSE